MTEEELAVVRRAYAKQILAVMDVRDDRLEAAFAAVAREDYLGAGPWPILRYGTSVPSPSADPVYLYTDDLVAIDPTRKLNNGQPSLHARLLASAAPASGDHAVHVGAGGRLLHGYFGRTRRPVGPRDGHRIRARPCVPSARQSRVLCSRRHDHGRRNSDGVRGPPT